MNLGLKVLPENSIDAFQVGNATMGGGGRKVMESLPALTAYGIPMEDTES